MTRETYRSSTIGRNSVWQCRLDQIRSRRCAGRNHHTVIVRQHAAAGNLVDVIIVIQIQVIVHTVIQAIVDAIRVIKTIIVGSVHSRVQISIIIHVAIVHVVLTILAIVDLLGWRIRFVQTGRDLSSWRRAAIRTTGCRAAGCRRCI